MPKILVIGSANMDYTVRLERLPQPGETVSEGEFYRAFGGKGANQALAASRAGATVRLVARLGRDDNGDAIAGHLTKEGIDTAGLLRGEVQPTGVALIMVDRSGNNAIAVAPGSNRRLTVGDLEGAIAHFEWADVLLIQLEIPLTTVEAALRMAKDRGLLTVLNPAPAAALSEDMLSLVDILTPNESEAGTLSGLTIEDRDAAVKAAKTFLRAGVKSVIVTLGANGICLVSKDVVDYFPAFSVHAVDATAAGDAFNGALVCAVAEGKPLSQAVPFAVAAGAVAVTRKGAQTSIPRREEIERLLERHAKSRE